MNKLKVALIIVLTILLSYSCSSIKIVEDNKTDYTRSINTELKEMKIGEASYSFGLSLFSHLGTMRYNLSVNSLLRIDEGDILLLKLGNEEVVKLTANIVTIGKVDSIKYSSVEGAYLGIGKNVKVDKYFALYNIDAGTLDRIERYGIIKIRIEHMNRYHEQSWSSNELGKFLKKSREKLEEQFKKSPKSAMLIEEGF